MPPSPLRSALARGALGYLAIAALVLAATAYAGLTSEHYESTEESLPFLVRLAFFVADRMLVLTAAAAIASFALATAKVARERTQWVEWSIATGISALALTLAVALVSWRAEQAELTEAVASLGGRHVVPSLWPMIAWASPVWAPAICAALHARLLRPA